MSPYIAVPPVLALVLVLVQQRPIGNRKSARSRTLLSCDLFFYFFFVKSSGRRWRVAGQGYRAKLPARRSGGMYISAGNVSSPIFQQREQSVFHFPLEHVTSFRTRQSRREEQVKAAHDRAMFGTSSVPLGVTDEGATGLTEEKEERTQADESLVSEKVPILNIALWASLGSSIRQTVRKKRLESTPHLSIVCRPLPLKAPGAIGSADFSGAPPEAEVGEPPEIAAMASAVPSKP